MEYFATILFRNEAKKTASRLLTGYPIDRIPLPHPGFPDHSEADVKQTTKENARGHPQT